MTHGAPVDDGPTDYEKYLRVGSLLSLQKDLKDMAHRDEHLFQIMHQTAELWFHQMLFDFPEMERRIVAGDAVAATRLVRRGIETVRILTDQFKILATMLPWDYHRIRVALARGSGQESPGFNKILAEAPRFQRLYLALLKRRGTTLDDLVMGRTEGATDLLDLGEHLVEFDEAFQLWRERHLAFVKRMIGQGQKSLKGYSVDQLEKHIRGHAFYPELYAVRDTMTLAAGTSPPGTTPDRLRDG